MYDSFIFTWKLWCLLLDDFQADEESASSIGEPMSVTSNSGAVVKRTLTLRGQMIFMSEWNALLFIGTPVYVSYQY